MGPRPDLHPETVDGIDAMRRLQDRVADAAVFSGTVVADPPVAGVDQAFPHSEAVLSAAVAMADDVVETAVVRDEVPIGYIPGLLAFREGPTAIAAVESLSDDPSVVLVDGNGRIHPRQAGLATHLGVVLGVPTVGVAKSLLCGEPTSSIDDLAAGDRVAIRAGDDLDVPAETVIGHAVQTRQFADSDRHVNPLIVSPGHAIGAEAAVEAVLSWCDRYKLPEPLRRADARAGDAAHPKDDDTTA